ncbi:ESPR-type extended signal peptide-containing protein, partial [Exercitatus varius]|uniref:ESPR-type extended signal peptide-containing protein n=1 Tax=Exercitatus varius TaxID=67857 RepID=UPI00294AC344
MNHIYKVIWNKTTQSLVVVSELAASRSKTKSSKRRAKKITQETIELFTKTVGTLTLGSAVLSSAPVVLAVGAAAIFKPSQAEAYVNNVSYARAANYSVAIGANTTANYTASAMGGESVAIGGRANSSGYQSLAIGTNTTASGDQSISIGSDVHATGYSSIAIGSDDLDQIAGRTIAGYYVPTGYTATHAAAAGAIVLGARSVASGRLSTILGSLSTASADGATVLGSGSNASGQSSTIVGFNSTASAVNATVVGSFSVASASNAIAIGTNSKAVTENTTAIGSGAYTQGYNSTAIGMKASTWENNGVAIGSYANATGVSAISVGTNSIATETGSAAYGMNANASNVNALAIGTGTQAKSRDSVAIGNQSVSAEVRGVAIGTNANVASAADDGIAIGTNAVANGKQAIAAGLNASASANNTVALGSAAQALAENAISIGTGNIVTGKNSGAIGDPTTITGSGTYSIGNNNGVIAADDSGVFGNNNDLTGAASGSRIIGNDSSVSASDGFVMGNRAQVKGEGGVAVGNNAIAEESYDMAIGYSAKATGIGGSALAVGTNAKASGTNAVGIGNGATATNTSAIALGGAASGYSSTALGYVTKAEGTSSTAVGYSANAKGAYSTAVGSTANASGTNSISIGGSSSVSSSSGVAIGTKANTTGTEAIALGANANSTVGGGVALGANSQSIRDASAATPYIPETANALQSNAINATKATTGAVSVGSDTVKRQIINVAAGSEDSDAVNVAQLKAAVSSTSWSLQNNGVQKDEIKSGDTVNFVNGTGTVAQVTGNSTNSTVKYSVDMTGLNVASDGTVSAVKNGDKFATAEQVAKAINDSEKTTTVNSTNGTIAATATTSGTVTNYDLDLSQAAKDSLAKADSALQSWTAQVNGSTAKVVNQTNNTVNFVNGTNTVVSADASGNISVSTAENVTFNTVNASTFNAGDVSISNNGINAGGKTVTNVANGTKDSDAVNFSQLNATNTNVANNAQNITNNANNISNNTKAIANNTQNITTNANNIAANTAAIKQGFNIGADNGNDDNVQLGETVNYNGDSNIITTVSNNAIAFALNSSIAVDNVTVNDTFKAGDVTINSAGIDAGNHAITNVTAGTNATDAVNLGQLNASKSQVKSGDNTGVTSTSDANGTVYTVNANTSTVSNGSDKVTVTKTDAGNHTSNYAVDLSQSAKDSLTKADSALQSWTAQVNGAEAKVVNQTSNTVNFVNGTNTVVSADANGNISVSTAENVTFNTVNASTFNAGDVTINNNGINAGNHTITNVANGTKDSDAVNFSQLNATNANVTNNAQNITNNTNAIANNTQNITNNTNAINKGINFGNGTSANNFALGSTINVKPSDSNLVVKTVADGVELALADSIAVGNVTVNNTFKAGDVTINNAGIDAGNHTITNVTAGTNATDAVNLGQLEKYIGDNSYNWNLSDGTTSNVVADNSTVAIKGSANADSAKTAGIVTALDGTNVSVDLSDKTKSDIQQGVNANTTVSKGFNIGADKGADDNVQLGETVNYNGDSNIITTVSNNAIAFALNSSLNLTDAGSVTMGDVVVNNGGITIANGSTNNQAVSLTKDGLNNGGNQITNVANGTQDSDAVNLAQLNASQSSVKAGDNVNVTSAKDANGTVYTVNANTSTVSNGSDKVTVTKTDAGNHTSNYAVDLSDAAKASLTKADSALQSWTAQVNGADVKVVNQTSNTVNFVNGTNTVVSADASGNISVSTAENVTFNTVNASTFNAGDVSISNNGINAGGKTVTNVANGTKDSDAVNLSQLNATNANVANNAQNITNNANNITNNTNAINKGINFGNGTTATKFNLGDTINVTSDSNLVVSTVTDGVKLTLADSIAVGNVTVNDTFKAGDVTINSAGIDAGNHAITNVTAGTNATDAVNLGQLKDYVGDNSYNWNLSDGTTSNAVADNSTVAIKGSANGDSAKTAGIVTALDGTNVSVDLSEQTKADIQQGVDANTTVNSKGITFAADSGTATERKLGDTLTVNGDGDLINTTASAGKLEVAATDKLKEAVTNATSALQSVVTQIDGKDVKTLNKADNKANFVSGDNISLTDDGQGGIKVATKDNVTFTTVNATTFNAGDVSISNNGINAGGKVVTNVANGTQDSDAVNLSQLNATNTNVANNAQNITNNANNITNNTNAINKGINFGNGTTATKFNLGDTINVTSDSNLVVSTVTDGVKLTLADSIAVGNVTVNDTFKAGDVTINSAGIDAGNHAITNVTAGTNATDAVNVAQLEANTTRYYSVNSTATGNRKNDGATGANAMAAGANATASGDNATAIGQGTKANSAAAIAIGNNANATSSSNDSVIAIGNNAQSTGSYSIAVGTNSVASNTWSMAMGISAKATGDYATGLGSNAQATAQWTTALGAGANATESAATAVGSNATAGADGATVIGYNSSVTGANTTALGNNINVGTEGSVVLGNNSAAATATTETAATVNNLTYSGFAGAGNVVAGDYVSVGSAGQERQIKYVAPGNISATSTDAINGSQLYATNRVLGNVANSVVNNFGGNAAVDSNGNITFTDIGGTGETTIHDAIKNVSDVANTGWNVQTNGDTATKVAPGDTVQFKDGKNIKITRTDKDITVATADNVSFNSINTSTLTAGPVTINSNGIDAGSQKITNVATGTNGTDAVNLDQLNQTISASAYNWNISDGTNTADVPDNGTVAVKGSANADSANISGIVTTLDGTNVSVDLSDKAKDSLGKADTAIQTLTTSADGKLAQTLNKDDNNANFTSGKNIVLTPSATGIAIATADNVTFTTVNATTFNAGDVVVSEDGINAGNKTITNVAAGQNGTDAVNVDQLNAVNATANAGWKLTANGTNSSDVKPNDIVDLANKDGNINITKDGNNVTFDLNSNLTVGGKDGKDGQIGAMGANGTGVVLNGKDGTIGINGTDGTNGTVTLAQGPAGVDGVNGTDRIVYETPNGTSTVATLDDGLIFTGNNEVLNKHKLNSTVNIIGEGVDKD